MASFNVSINWGKWLAKRGFRVEPNKTYVPPVFPITRRCGKKSKQRPMRVFAPEDLKGKLAKKWFKQQFYMDHKFIDECPCCPPVSIPTFPKQ